MPSYQARLRMRRGVKKEINSPKLTLNFVLVILVPLVVLLLVMMHRWGVF